MASGRLRLLELEFLVKGVRRDPTVHFSVVSLASHFTPQDHPGLPSWPLFTLSHYYLVWWCAEQVYPSKRFTRYAILGDDICIADSKVAKVYRDALETLKVQVSLPKSLVSEIGCAEFAKKFRVRGLTVDLSPVSFQNLLNSHHIAGAMAVANTYSVR